MDEEIGYRARIINPRNKNTHTPYWFGNYRSYGGGQGVFESVSGLKNSMRSNGHEKGTYEIWKFYIGLDPSEWFEPEKVE